MIKMSAYTGFTALALVFELTTPLIKSEALWLSNADGNRGSVIEYIGTQDGMNIWKLEDGSMMRIKSTPRHLTREENEQIEAALKPYYARMYEQLVDHHSKFGRML
jgi:hypothetical protein